MKKKAGGGKASMKKNVAPRVSPEHDSFTTVKRAVDACLEAKGQDVTVLSLKNVSDIAEYFIIVTGRSDRQVQGISNRILDTLGTENIEPFSIDGIEHAHWVVMDYQEIVIHIFYEPVRAHYDLEGLWAKAERVRIPGCAPRESSPEIHAI